MRKIILSSIILIAFFSSQAMLTEAQQSKAAESVHLLRPAALYDIESAEMVGQRVFTTDFKIAKVHFSDKDGAVLNKIIGPLLP